MVKKGIMTFRICGIRVFDTVLTILGLWLLFWLLQWRVGKLNGGVAVATGLALALVCTFPLAILGHAIFGVPTALNCALKLANPSKCAALKSRIRALELN